jgi:predicted nucleic acid-binding Zn finger protein
VKETSTGKDELRGRLEEFSGYGQKFDRALDTVLARGVKECRFIPSERRVFTVVGRFGDEFIDPEKPYCSCSNFFFNVARGKDELCYHLLSHRMASRLGKVDVVEFSDEEYDQYITAVARDVFEVLGKSVG